MTREEAIILFEKQLTAAQVVLDSGFGSNPGENDSLYRRRKEMAEIALSALRPASREQVEKVWRGEWITKHYVDGILEGTNFDECSKCGYQRVFENPELKTKYIFCPNCGAPMTDEAVQMVMERMEALKDGKDI